NKQHKQQLARCTTTKHWQLSKSSIPMFLHSSVSFTNMEIPSSLSAAAWSCSTAKHAFHSP
ncbi:hypothetical protein LSAT2_028572, partial [Lamellibrachia satsuma]